MFKNIFISNAIEKLKQSPLKVTKQRKKMLELLFKNGDAHVTAEQIYNQVNKNRLNISLATVYNSLNQFTEIGLLKSIKISSDKIFYDTNTREHHHFFCQDSGTLTDISSNLVKISRLPKIPKGKSIKSVDVIINISG